MGAKGFEEPVPVLWGDNNVIVRVNAGGKSGCFDLKMAGTLGVRLRTDGDNGVIWDLSTVIAQPTEVEGVRGELPSSEKRFGGVDTYQNAPNYDDEEINSVADAMSGVDVVVEPEGSGRDLEDPYTDPH
jgi:hypothetical protein